MAFRIDSSSISHGSLCNRKRGSTIVSLELADGRTINANLEGNPYRDIAGRILSFRHPSPEPEAPLPGQPALQQTGHAGDITASRKVKVPTIPVSEIYRNPDYKDGNFPHTWKNALYLEWFSRENGRVVIESTDFELSLSDPAWEMTKAEEMEAKKDAHKALTRFLDQLCDITRERNDSSKLVDEKERLDEHDHEQLLRFSDRMNDRYGELIDKFGTEEEETIDSLMGWDESKESEPLPDCGTSAPDWTAPDDDWQLPDEHPLLAEVEDLLEDFTPRSEQDEQEQEVFFAVAMVRAKLAGALSAWDGTEFNDNSFTIALLKRVLGRIDTAVALTDESLTSKLLILRQGIIDLQQKLRGS